MHSISSIPPRFRCTLRRRADSGGLLTSHLQGPCIRNSCAMSLTRPSPVVKLWNVREPANAYGLPTRQSRNEGRSGHSGRRVLTTEKKSANIASAVCGRWLPPTARSFEIEKDVCQRRRLYGLWPLSRLLPDGTFSVEGHNEGVQERDSSPPTSHPRGEKGGGLLRHSMPSLY